MLLSKGIAHDTGRSTGYPLHDPTGEHTVCRYLLARKDKGHPLLHGCPEQQS